MPAPFPIRRHLLALLATLIAAGWTSAATRFHEWPISQGQAIASDKYEVYVTAGTAPEVRLDTVMSHAIFEGDWRAVELEGRTFSFAALDCDPADGPLQFRVVKKFGISATGAVVQPRSYGIASTLVGGVEARFTVTGSERYLSVQFLGSDNETSPNRWIKHMLAIFIDPPETDRPDPTDAGVVTFEPGVSAATLAAASTITFPAGYHDLRAYSGGAPIADGILTLKHQQSVYLASGAWVDGLIATSNTQTDRYQVIHGRGVLSGRKHPWYNKPGYAGPRYQQIIRLGQDASISGVIVMESPSHGVVAGNRAGIRNMKYVGWHSNNDGVRVGSGSEIQHCFIRAVDDHFYNFDIHVHDCVLWAAHNGAILTYGWGGDGVEAVYNSGSSLLEDIDIIHPEWLGLGNNNGIVAAQTGFNYKPWGYNGATLTVVRRLRIDGTIPCLLNLKPRSQSDGIVSAVQVPDASLGYLGDLLIQDITVDALSARARIRGGHNATTPGAFTYLTRNVQIDGLSVGGVPVTEASRATYFDIEAATTAEIRFTQSGASEGLQARYLFEGDWSDAAHALGVTAVGEVSFVDGRAGGQAAHFDGSTGYLTAPRTLHEDFTIACWVRSSQSVGAGAWTSGVGIVDASISGSGVDFGTSLLGGRFAFGVGNADTTLVSTSTVADGTWRHIAATRDGITGEMKVYVDGVLEASHFGPIGVRGNTSTLRIGNLLQGGGFLAGDLDDVRLYSRVLSAREMFALGGSIAAPTSFVAIQPSLNTVALTWQDPAENEAGFTIQRSESPDGPWTTLPDAGANITETSDRHLSGGRTYHYRLRAYNSLGESAWTPVVSATIPPSDGAPAELVNFSCRLHVDSGAVAIPGFVFAGSGTRRVLVRAAGPVLTSEFGVPGAMADPELALYADGTLVMTNDDWDPVAIGTAFAETGAFTFPNGGRDAALVAEAEVGRSFTVHVRGGATEDGNPAGGIVLIEVYLLPDDTPSGRLSNASIRAQSRPGDGVLILGFVLEGGAQRSLLIRGIGPTLSSDFGIPHTLPDPHLRVFDGANAPILAADDWDESSGLAAMFTALGSFLLSPASADAALLTSLQPTSATEADGRYTVHVGDLSGAAGETLVELYLAP